MGKGLTPKHAAFVREYLIDLNSTQAAIRAGYSKKTAHSQGPRLLENVEVQKEVARLQAERSKRTAITSDYVLENLQGVLERCMQRAPVLVREGREMVQAVDDEGRNVWEFNANGANKSLELLGKHLAMWTEKHEHKHDFGDLTDAQLAARFNALVASNLPPEARPTVSAVAILAEGADVGLGGDSST